MRLGLLSNAHVLGAIDGIYYVFRLLPKLSQGRGVDQEGHDGITASMAPTWTSV